MVVLLLVLGPLGEHGHVLLAGNGLGEVDLVQVLLLVGEAGEVGDPVPACEGVALAGGLCGLAHHAVGVGNALHGIVAVSELAAVSSVQDVDFVLVLHPLGIHRCMRLGNRLAEIDLVLLFLLFGEDAQVGNPIPAGEGVALAGGSRGLAHHAVRVGEALLNFLTVKELAAIGNIQNVGLVLYFILRKRKLGLGRLLRSSSPAILIGVIGQCYCRHATKSKRQAQACRNCFLRTQILHLFSFSHCIRTRLYASD